GATTAPDPALANNAAPPVAPDSATNAHIEPVDDTKAAVPNATLQLVPKFGFGKVHQATIVQVQLDGPIPTIHGARLANGFTVSVPGRRTTDRAALLGRADPRLANVKVVNRAKGTELTFEFRDTVPAFMVRARGDHLEVSLGQSVPSRGPVAARTSNADHARTDERRHSTRSTNSR
ncbi:MAG TPA: hypothetical protein VGL13_15250, partial [Polyangiaceae bacterium]